MFEFPQRNIFDFPQQTVGSIKVDITIDENNCIRILPSDKYIASEKLQSESNKFVSSMKIFLKDL